MAKQTHYCDNNATTAVDPEVWQTVSEYALNFYGNPSSHHEMGLQAERAVKQARQTLAEIVNVKACEVLFTSSGTESVNLAIKGTAYAQKRRGRHIITSPIEHEAVLASVKQLHQQGFDVDYVDVDDDGQVRPEAVYRKLRDDTVLVAVMHVNNELGTINPVERIAKEVKSYDPKITVFVDGAQAFGKSALNLNYIDMYAISAHKFHGPKGVGALVTKEGIQLQPLLTGGGHEFNYRSGTENVPGIMGLAHAARLAYDHLETNRRHLHKLKHKLLQGLNNIPEVKINSPKDGLDTTVNASICGLPSEVILNALENEGIYVSSGAACSGTKKEASHVLEALGLPASQIQAALRFSFSKYNTEQDIDHILSTLNQTIPKIRQIAK